MLVGFVYVNCSENGDKTKSQVKFSNFIVVEGDENNGSIDASIDAEILGDVFVDNLELGKDYFFSGVPDGVQVRLVQEDNQNIEIKVGGSADYHVRCDYDTIAFSLAESAVQSGILPANNAVEFYVVYFGGTIPFQIARFLKNRRPMKIWI